MKLAEALLQDKPIKRKGFSQWCKPEIVESNVSPFAALPTVCDTDKYTLDYINMTADDWEIKSEPMKHEFTAEFMEVNGWLVLFNLTVRFLVIKDLVDSGKRFKVTCEEIVE